MIMNKKIIIDEKLCNGCGLCIPYCKEGALQITDGKAKFIDNMFCDALGECIGSCPEGAISIIETNDQRYNTKILNNTKPSPCNCPAVQKVNILNDGIIKESENLGNKNFSQLNQWPIQLHLLHPNASYLYGADVLISADCTAFVMGDFHNKFMKDKKIAIGCPKLDEHLEDYVDKIHFMIDEAKINSITVAVLTVPCCQGLFRIVKNAAEISERKLPIKLVLINIKGEIENESFIN